MNIGYKIGWSIFIGAVGAMGMGAVSASREEHSPAGKWLRIAVVLATGAVIVLIWSAP